MIRPQLADDADINAVRFDCYVQPKIDGVRAMNLAGTLTGRSLDPFKGFGITQHFSKPCYVGFDGEMTLGDKANSEDRLCSLTTGAMGRFKGVTEMPNLHWWVFDLVLPETIALPYAQRYEMLSRRVLGMGDDRIHLVPNSICHTPAELKLLIGQHADAKYEGTIIRSPYAPYKPGRPTQKGQELWRVKPWADFEILVTGIVEGETNTNVAKVNTLGRTERSSAKAGKVPKGMVGSIQGTLLQDFHDPLTGKLLFKKGLLITAGKGEMTDPEALAYFKNPSTIIGHIAKVKHMTHGVKDLPRFPTFVSLRLPQDMS